MGPLYNQDLYTGFVTVERLKSHVLCQYHSSGMLYNVCWLTVSNLGCIIFQNSEGLKCNRVLCEV
jgi:hypothetical protein